MYVLDCTIIASHTQLIPPQITIATKVNPWSSGGMTRTRVLEQAAISLDSLQKNSVDLLYLHAPDHNTPLEETLGAIQELYKGDTIKSYLCTCTVLV